MFFNVKQKRSGKEKWEKIEVTFNWVKKETSSALFVKFRMIYNVIVETIGEVSDISGFRLFC